mmetsp:Transcript_47718/g.113574  ORF Transcript_47718/g.113574 Transcript_47718/m.113574 type:complete len:366 (-) Transcript_47718:208-1305(-)
MVCSAKMLSPSAVLALVAMCMIVPADAFRHYLPTGPSALPAVSPVSPISPGRGFELPFRTPPAAPQGMPKSSDSRISRQLEQVQALARTVASIKQEISRRDVFKEMAKKIFQTTGVLCPALSFLPTPRAYAEDNEAAAGVCPNLKEMGKKSREPGFSENLYQGIWYELAYHDVTQANYFCGCTRFNFTIRSDKTMEDMFTTTCPMTGMLPREDIAKSIYTLNMTIQYNKAKPGEFLEKGFAYNFPNIVLYVWTKTGKDGKQYYDRSLQMQCVEAAGKILFIGINFLARSPKVSAVELEQMFDKAREVGIDKYGGDKGGMYLVKHDGCMYPVSTDASVMGPRSDFPGPLLDKVELYAYPDARVDSY